MKNSILKLMSSMALFMAVMSLSVCSAIGGRQPALTDTLKDSVRGVKGGQL